MTKNNIDPELAKARARLAGLASAAKQTAEERSKRASHAATVRHERRRAEQEALAKEAGAIEPPEVPDPPAPTPEPPPISERLAAARVDFARVKQEAAARARTY